MLVRDCWVGYRIRRKKGGGIKKLPVCLKKGSPRFGRGCDPTRLAHGTTFYEAATRAREFSCCGIGYLLGSGDEIVLIDLDGVRNPETGEIDDRARSILAMFPGTYVEVSASGTGLHILVRGRVPEDKSVSKRWIQVFAADGYMTVTGETLHSDHRVPRRMQGPLDELFRIHGSNSPKTPPDPRTPTGPKTTGLGSAAGSGKLTGRDRATIYSLGAWSLWRRLYVGGEWEDRYPSQSEADLALMGLVALRSKDLPQHEAVGSMVRIFRTSALAKTLFRKGRNVGLYLERTARTAYANRNHTGFIYQGAPGMRRGRMILCAALMREAVEVSRSGGLPGPWLGLEGTTDFALYLALVSRAVKFGRVTDSGVEVRVSCRTLALDSGLARHQTALESGRRLKEAGLLHIPAGRKARSPARYVLRPPNTVVPADRSLFRLFKRRRREKNTRAHHKVSTQGEWCGSEALYLFSRQLCRFRDSHGSGVDGPGKVAAYALSCAVYLGEFGLGELAGLTGRRRDSLKSRYLEPLVRAGLLLENGGVYWPVPALAAALKRHHALGGVVSAEEFQRQRYAQERGLWNARFSERIYGPVEDPDAPPPASAESSSPTDLKRIWGGSDEGPDDEVPTLGMVRRVA